MDKTVIDKAVGKKYTEFSAEIKQQLQNKLANHEISQAYSAEYDRIQDMKAAYAAITGGDTEE
jgi:hypothetical protein